jgi:hypothetical protein
MRAVISLLSLVVVLGISMGIYYMYLKQASPTPGSTATQAISTTAVEMDLMSIAQAERMYYVQKGAYADLNELSTNGTMNINRDGRDGYTYALDVTGDGFTATAHHDDMPAGAVNAAAGAIHYPTLSVDQTMQVHRGN